MQTPVVKVANIIFLIYSSLQQRHEVSLLLSPFFQVQKLRHRAAKLFLFAQVQHLVSGRRGLGTEAVGTRARTPKQMLLGKGGKEGV